MQSKLGTPISLPLREPPSYKNCRQTKAAATYFTRFVFASELYGTLRVR